MKQLYSLEPQKSFVTWILSQVIILFSSITIIGYILDSVNLLNFKRLSVTIIIAIVTLFMYNYKFKVAFNKREMIQSVIIFIAFFLIGIKPILLTFYPINHSVDFVHHYSLLNYIYEHQTLVKQAEGNLGEMYRYPFGIDLIQAYLSWVTGIDTLRIGHIFLTFIFALTSLSFYGLIQKIFANIENVNKNIVALCSPFLLLILKDYSLSEYWISYHSSQMLGNLIIIVVILMLSEIESNNIFRIGLILSSITLLLTFPLWIAIFNFFVIMFFLLSNSTLRNKILNIIFFIIPQIIVFIIYYKQGYVLSAISISGINGATTKPSISSIGGYLFILLFALGIILFLRKLEKKEIIITSVEIIFALVSISIIIQFVSLKLLTKFGFGSEYIVTKTFFLARYFYVAIIAYSILEISKYIKINPFSKKVQYFVTSSLLLIVFCISILFLIPKTAPLINHGEYKLSLEVKNNDTKNNMMLFPYPVSSVTSYFIYTGIWKQDRIKNPTSYNYLFNRNIPNLMEWMTGNRTEEYALIGDVYKQLIETNLLQYVTITSLNNNSAIVKRNSNSLKFSKKIELLNASFENSDTNWKKVIYSGNNFEANIDTNRHYDGSKSMYVKGVSTNAGISQKIKLESNKIYKITAWCSGKNIVKQNGYGAFMSIEGSNSNIAEWSQGDFDWQKKEMIFDSKNLSEINLVLGLGAFGSASGEAWFDDIEIYELTN